MHTRGTSKRSLCSDKETLDPHEAVVKLRAKQHGILNKGRPHILSWPGAPAAAMVGEEVTARGEDEQYQAFALWPI
jgi:hypothetical protein